MGDVRHRGSASCTGPWQLGSGAARSLCSHCAGRLRQAQCLQRCAPAWLGSCCVGRPQQRRRGWGSRPSGVPTPTTGCPRTRPGQPRSGRCLRGVSPGHAASAPLRRTWARRTFWELRLHGGRPAQGRREVAHGQQRVQHTRQAGRVRLRGRLCDAPGAAPRPPRALSRHTQTPGAATDCHREFSVPQRSCLRRALWQPRLSSGCRVSHGSQSAALLLEQSPFGSRISAGEVTLGARA